MDEQRKKRLIAKYSKSSAKMPGGSGGPGGPGGPRPGPGGGKMKVKKPQDTKKAIARLMGYLSEDKGRLIFVFFCVIAGTIANLAGSYMLRPIINGLTGEGSSAQKLLHSLLTMAGIYIIGVTAQYLQQRIMIGVSQGALEKIRNDLFVKMQHLPVRFYDTNNHGDLMSRYTNDLDAVGDMLNNTVLQIISSVITVVGTLGLMLYTNVWLTIVTVVMVPLMMKAGGAVAGKSRKFYQAQQAAIGTLNGYIEETMTGQKVVKVFCHEDVVEEEFEYLNDDLRGKQIFAQFFGGIMGPVMGNLSQVSYSLTAMIGGILCVLQGFDIGGLTVFVNYSRQFSRPINELSMQMNTIFSALAGAERVFQVMDEAPETADAADAVVLNPCKGHVELKDVTFGYVPGHTILKHISLYAKPGQKIAFVGSTGAGKTTITNLINRFYEIDSGEILMDGVDIRKVGRENLRSNIAMVLQDTHLFTGTIRENIRYGRLDATDAEGRLIFVFFCVIAGTIANLAGSYMLRPIINGLTGEGSSAQKLLHSLLTMAGIYIIGVTAQYLQQRIMIGVSQGALEKIRNDLFVKMQHLPVRFYDTNNHGDLMSRYTNDLDAVGDMLNNTVLQIISSVITVVGTLGLMLYTNVWLTIVTVVMVPLMMKAGGAVAGKSRKFYQAQQAAIGTLNGYIEETMTGQKVVKVFCHEDVVEEEFEYLNDDLRGKQIFAQFFGGIMGPVMGNLSQVSYSLTAMIGGILCVLQGFDIGGLTVFVNYSRQFSRPINELSMQMNTIFSALAGAERVFQVMDEAPETADAADAVVLNPCKGHVELKDVTFGYVPGHTILKHISLYAKPGQKIAFVGSTGAGKTTITNLINRFYEIDSGEILMDGVDIRKVGRENLRSNIAMVLQDTHLFTGTIRENIRYGRLDATDAEVEQAAKMASAHSFIMRLENGYDTMIEGDGANLSQGQRQLLNIARAAISKAPVLILDEATSSVDTRTERHIEHGMDRLMADRTTLVIAHRLSTVRNANAIMVLENGEIIERGDHDQLLEQKGRYYELYTGKKQLA